MTVSLAHQAGGGGTGMQDYINVGAVQPLRRQIIMLLIFEINHAQVSRAFETNMVMQHSEWPGLMIVGILTLDKDY